MITNQHIHVRSTLTDNCLLKDALGQLDLQQGYWVRLDHVIITNQVQERFDKGSGGAQVVGHFVVQSAPFVIQQYHDLQPKITEVLRAYVDRVVAEKGWAPIERPPTKYRLDA